MKKIKFCIYCRGRLSGRKRLYCSTGCKNKYHAENPKETNVKQPNKETKIIGLKEWYGEKYPERKPQEDIETLKSAFGSLSIIIKKIKETGCMVCGYNKTYSGLHFHHMGSKGETVARLARGSMLGFLKEFLEHDIVLICANCHAEVHDNVLDVSYLKPININDVISENTTKFGQL